MKINPLFYLVALLSFCRATHAGTITFDDLPATDFATLTASPYLVPDGYDNLNWHNLAVLDTSDFPASGYINGLVSPNNVMIIPDFRPPPIGNQTIFPPATISASAPFLIESGFFTSVRYDGVLLEVKGLNGAAVAFDETFVVNATAPSFLAFPDVPITEVDFTSSGGNIMSNIGYFGGGIQIAVDNLTIDFVNVPETVSTALLLAAGAGGLALLRKRLA